MAEPLLLHDLIEAIANAVIYAQDRIEQHQINNALGYFDDEGTPKTVDIGVPSMSLDANTDLKKMHVPLVTLVKSNLLRIKDVEISFDVELTGLIPADAHARPLKEESTLPPREVGNERDMYIGVGLSARAPKERGATAHVVLRVEGQEPTEGMSRLIHHLVKMI